MNKVSFGAFAKKPQISTEKSTDPSDDLLPYEREAIQARLRSTQKPIQPKRRTTPSDGQSNKSKTILADVFNTNRSSRQVSSADSGFNGKGIGATGLNTQSASQLKGSLNQKPFEKGSRDRFPTSSRRSQSDAFSDRKTQSPGKKIISRQLASSEDNFWNEFEKRAKAAVTPAKKPGQNSKASFPDWSEDFPKGKHTRPSVDNVTRNISGEKESTLKEKGRFEKREPQQAKVEPPPQRREMERPSKSTKQKGKIRRASNNDADWSDEAVDRWERKQQRKAEKDRKQQLMAGTESSPTPIFLPEYISVNRLAGALKQDQSRFLRDMGELGFENVTSDTIMTGETAAMIALEYGFDPSIDDGVKRDLKPRPLPEDMTSLPQRPPVVTIMGHVDHGKTTLLDWLRKSSVAAQEHGGITQHIGAFVVKMSSGKPITFLDTPGHAAFLTMRQRGANVTDIVVLVVAADDSIMPQTLEALKHSRAAKVPIIVAINKIDKEDARVDNVKSDLARHGVEIEDYGGDVQVVLVSGKTGQGMDDLEENIVTLSEILDVRAEKDGMAEGWVLESSIKLDGKAATVLVKRGTLRPGDLIVAGKSWARIRVLRNEAGVELTEAPPGTPVEILGWRDLPEAGQQIIQAPDEDKAKTAVEYRREMSEREDSGKQLAEQEQRQREKALREVEEAEEPGKGIEKSTEPTVRTQNFVVRADVAGSVEAVCGCLLEIGNNEVRSQVLRSAAGQITEFDVDHAAVSNSILVNFNNSIQPHIKQRAADAKVQLLDHSIIYHLVDEAKEILSSLLPVTITHRTTGEADILQIFPINIRKRVTQNIAGCRVRNGTMKNSALVKVIRNGNIIFEGKFLPSRWFFSMVSLTCACAYIHFRQDRYSKASEEGCTRDGQGNGMWCWPRQLRRIRNWGSAPDIRACRDQADYKLEIRRTYIAYPNQLVCKQRLLV